ncbi:FISUMP domain-containing protein [Bacteroides sp. 51]|uniref:FISUMP domain-containing protein n=1 Tax=Bacteroides sp. 51 TaxID=2302938 RepID=UPI0013CFB13D|nr:FISUMP domain-containing protein [Bacteroides sp. 51]NDV82454.1 hypothetical protein [Bacteroides sp. 51]
MKKIINCIALLTVILLVGCEDDVKYVNPTWARQVFPEEGSTVKIDFFKPDEIQPFVWEVRPNSTYKVYFDVDMHFENAVEFDMGNATDTLKIRNEELLETLRTVWPDFGSIKRFFWKVEQNTNGKIETSWRYFSAMLSIESFIDARDGERYEARQFVMEDGSLITIMAENLRAKVYADGEALPFPARVAITGNTVFDYKAGGYYSWQTAVRVTWDEAKAASLDGKPIQGICPDGWHVPSYSEFVKLREHIGRWDTGLKMKDPSFWRTTSEVTNSSKMNVIASGYYWREDSEALFNWFESADMPVSGFWTSTPRLKGIEYSWGDIALDDERDRATVMTFYDDAAEANIQAYGIVPGGENRHYPIRCIMNDL